MIATLGYVVSPVDAVPEPRAMGYEIACFLDWEGRDDPPGDGAGHTATA